MLVSTVSVEIIFGFRFLPERWVDERQV